MFISANNTPSFPAIRFEFKSSYMGCTWFTVTDQTGTYEAKLRRVLGSYERSILNPHAAPEDVVSFADQVASEIGILSRCVCDNAGEISAETIAAFNHWRLTEHNRVNAYFEERDMLDACDLLPPPVVTAGRWTRGHGWTAVAAVEMERAA